MVANHDAKEPASQAVHLLAPALAKVPAAHGWQVGWPIIEYEPAMQSSHAGAKCPEKRPAAHGEQIVEPAAE